MTTVAVVAHSRKSFGGGLPELREVLAREGFTDPLWLEPESAETRAASAGGGSRRRLRLGRRVGWRSAAWTR
jgi:hypothetical protein